LSDREFNVCGQLVDVVQRTIAPAKLTVRDGIIADIVSIDSSQARHFLLPGFVDSHIHIESSMLLPSQFARAAVVHGTVATVSDPHEIANVCGIEGVELMLRDAAQTGFKFCFGAPACVPATAFETAGARLDAPAVARLLDDPRIGYLSEMMNFPGVLAGDHDVMAKLAAAHARGKPVDGHAPGLRGVDARKYVAAGISTDHECVAIDEALEKIAAGCKIAIREGSAARNFDALQILIDQFPDQCMFCSDDKHPDELLLGHINLLAARAVAEGRDLINVLQACSVNAVKHYGLNIGLLQRGDPADFVIVSDLRDFQVLETYIDGRPVAKNGQCLLPEPVAETINRFNARPIKVTDLQVKAQSDQIRIIRARDGQLMTDSAIVDARVVGGAAVTDVSRDLLKLVVLNRYEPAEPAVAFISGFGLKRGAIASSVAHDCHNIVAVGASDADICSAINAVVEIQGGLSVACDRNIDVLPLPVAGLMSTESCQWVGRKYGLLDRRAKELGSTMRAPFMTLSFMALLVIPSLKLSDRGLFDGDTFEFASLFVSNSDSPLTAQPEAPA
jgi:adenine deaminase